MDSVVETTPSFPTASVTPRTRSNWLWWIVPLVCLVACIGLFYYAESQGGVRIKIEFREGHGLKPLDVVKHKGIVVGEVEKIELNRDLDRVTATVRLAVSARSLAKEGSRFWIVRPSINIDSIGGLDTILGAKYLAVSPGPMNGANCFEFVGLDSVPIVAPKSGSLEVVLDSPHRSGLMPNAPVLYRGYTIGRIIEIDLASDARSVRARCAIDPEFKNLVRTDSKFWKQTGWKLQVGLTGVKVDAETLPQLLTGSIEMATPGTVGEQAPNGASFELHPEAREEWLQWAPGIAGTDSNASWNALPTPVQITQSWEQSWFGWKSRKQSYTWMLPMDDGSLLGVSSQLAFPAKATEGSFDIQVADQVFDPTQIVVRPLGGSHSDAEVVLATFPDLSLGGGKRWPMGKLAFAANSGTVRNVIIVQQPVQASIWVDAARLKGAENAWLIHQSVPVTQDMTGLPVVDAESKLVLGTLAYDGTNQGGIILLIDPTQLKP